jgi:AmiR/NasT family two-component response regulator
MTISEMRRGLAVAREQELVAKACAQGARECLTHPLDENRLVEIVSYADNAFWALKTAEVVRYALRQAHG